MVTTEAPGDVETGNGEAPAADRPAPPTLLKKARLGNLDLFRTELETGNYPLDFKAGRAVYFNRTPLHLAAMEGHHEIVEFILSRPEISTEVVNAKDGFGYTPLHLAVRHSREGVVRLLTTSSLVLPGRFLAATSEPDDVGEHFGGYTPLHLAAMRRHTAIAMLLLRQPRQMEFAYDPVNILAMTWRNLTPLDLARLNNFPDLEGFLEDSDMNWLLQERDRCAISVNAILVGAALMAAATFVTWMQPPGGIPAPDSAALGASATSGAPTPSPSASSSSSGSDRITNSGFYLCVAIAFTFSFVSLGLVTMATFPLRNAALRNDLRHPRRAVNIAQRCLLVVLASLIMAFSLAVFDEVALTRNTLSKILRVIVAVFPSATSGGV